jgi:hypothetical protein
MTNQVHLLMAPQTVEGAARVMQSVGWRAAKYVNRT